MSNTPPKCKHCRIHIRAHMAAASYELRMMLRANRILSASISEKKTCWHIHLNTTEDRKRTGKILMRSWMTTIMESDKSENKDGRRKHEGGWRRNPWQVNNISRTTTRRKKRVGGKIPEREEDCAPQCWTINKMKPPRHRAMLLWRLTGLLAIRAACWCTIRSPKTSIQMEEGSEINQKSSEVLRAERVEFGKH